MTVEITVPHDHYDYDKLLCSANAWAEPSLEHRKQHFAVLCQSIEAWARELVGGSTHFPLKNENDGGGVRISKRYDGSERVHVEEKYCIAICVAQRHG